MKRFAVLLLASLCFGQDDPPKPIEVHFQATTITQTHGPFHAPYSGLNSLHSQRETDTSLTGTIFLSFRFGGTELGINPELAGGKGFSDVTGIAGFPNGEIPRVAKPTPTPYIARVYLKQKLSRFTWTFGKVSASDFFDNNSYSHDPRSQFQNWSLMDNAAWDYPADVRGYTVGAVQEVALGRSIARIGSFLEPVVANGPKLDTHFAASRADTVEWEYKYLEGGILRILGFVNQANMGTYRNASQDIIATRRSGTIKYGYGLNLQQRITGSVGVFSRWGWNDGKTESWAFTEVDRTLSAGVSVKGSRWKRGDDVFAAGLAVNAISGDHRAYLARGGYGFIIGDGQLRRPGREVVFETYYAWQVRKFLIITPDYQFIANPAYNRDRGPAHVAGVRVHVQK